MIPDAQKVHIEIVSNGLLTAQGSSAVPVVGVWHYRRSVQVNPPSKAQIQGAWQLTVAAALEAALNASFTHVSVDVRWLEDPTDPYLTTAIGNPGAIAGDRMNPCNTAFLFFRTAYRGREFQGRKFLSGMSESDTTAPNADIWNAGAITRLNALGAAHLAGFTDAAGNVFKPVVVSKQNSDFSVTPCVIASQDITAVVLNKRVGRFKRRQVASVY